LVEIWKTIPVCLCKRLCGSFSNKINLVKDHQGRRLDREILKKMKSKHKKLRYRWDSLMADDDKIERIAYNEKIIQKLIK
jgi:hypothetical protein